MKAPLAALLLTAAIGVHAAPPIDNGVEVAPGEYDQVVKLEIPGGMLCSGTLVGPRTILTAAHCLSGTPLDHPDIRVSFPGKGQARATRALVNPKYDEAAMAGLASETKKLGDWSKLDASQRKAAEEYALQYMALGRYDIGLIEIPPASRPFIPIRIRNDASSLTGVPVTLVGYGDNDHTAVFFGGSGTERKGANRVLACWRGLLFHAGEIRDRVYRWGGLATEADGKDAGIDSGDSGGPMLADGGVVGINRSSLVARIVYEALREELGPTGEKLYQMTKSGTLGWNVSVSLSSPESAEFLGLARSKGFDFAVVLDHPTLPPARPPFKPKSSSLDALKRGTPALSNQP